MGYEDLRVKGKIKDADRCGLCGQLCSIDLFLESKCYHLFCADCFEDYLKRNGHFGEIRDQSNYTAFCNPVRCPVSNRIILYKHISGALYLKIKQYFRLCRYKIRCKFYSFGCHEEVKANKLSKHYMQCFFTSNGTGNQIDQRHHHVFAPDYFNNHLYEDVKLRLRLMDKFEYRAGDLRFVQPNAEKSRKTDTTKSKNLVDLNSEDGYERVDWNDQKSCVDARMNKNDLALFNCLMMDRLPASKVDILKKNGDFDELKEQLNRIQKNVNFIQKQLLPSEKKKFENF